MKRAVYLHCITMLLLCFALSAQKISYLESINDDVWYPFIEAFEKPDADAFMAVHSEDVIRWTLDGGKHIDKKNYYAQQKEANQNMVNAGNSRKIELRFIHRSMRDTFVYEIGYYKVTYFEKNSTNIIDYYGKFNVILRKQSGVWKILMDADHGGATKTDFLEAYAINSYSKFPSMLIKKKKK